MTNRHPGIPAALLALSLSLAACADQLVEPREHPTVSAAELESFTSELESEAASSTGKHIVAFAGTRIPAGFARQVGDLGGTVSRTLDPLGVVVVEGLDDDAAAALHRIRGVRSVEPDLILELPRHEAEELVEMDLPAMTDDPSQAFFFPRQWHLRAIFADVAWDAGFVGSSDVTVSIVDTGIDYTHASLEGLVDLDRSISLHPWDDEILADSFPDLHPVLDMNRHGTHVAATVVSTGEVGAGVTSRTTLMGVKVCGATVGCPRSAVLEAIMYSADQGADIINLSLGGYFLRSEDRGSWLPLILRATNYAHQQGSLVVVSAGNNGEDLDHNQDEFKTYCSSTNVVCVSATGPTTRGSVNGPWNDFDQPAAFSNYGRSSIDVAAPGGNTNNFVYAACSSFRIGVTNCRSSNRFILGIRGTSMAAPHATGVAALIAAHVEGAQGNPAHIRNHLHQTADQVTSEGNDPYFGRGRVNAARAVGAM